MPLDGIVVKNIVFELDSKLSGGRIDKVYQVDRDEIIISVRSGGRSFRVLVTSNADFPRMCLTDIKSENPQSPPMFCMSLRKHLSGGKIVGFYQPQLERIIEIHVESMNELGDMSEKRLILEIMGKHSNIILVNEEGKILDCAKKVSFVTSSVREVLPGREYVYPPNQNKLDPLCLDKEQFIDVLKSNASYKVSDVIYKNYCGISPLIATEICVRANIIPTGYVQSLDKNSLLTVFESFRNVMELCGNNEFSPQIIYDKKSVLDFSSLKLTQFESFRAVCYSEISPLLEDYYGEKSAYHRLKQKTLDLRKLISGNIERCVKKRDILDKTMNDTKNMDEWRICGELLTSYMSFIQQGAKYYDAENYYAEETENKIKRINLKEDLTPSQNAARYFEKYNKAKRQKIAVTEQLAQNEMELQYLENLYNIVFTDISESEIREIKDELFEEGYIKKRPEKKGLKLKKSMPLHYVSTDGFDIYVGKNNRQNDELTLKIAKGKDIWFHTKEIPGSHVILITDGKEPTDTAMNEAALLAAFHSKAKDGAAVPVDYTQKKNVKKPSGAKPGMVIYENNKTAYITPNVDIINLIRQV